MNFEYQRALAVYDEPLKKIDRSIVELNSQITTLDFKIADFRSRLEAKAAEAAATTAKMTIGNAEPAEISKVAVEFGSQSAAISRDLGLTKSTQEALEQQKKNLDKSRDELAQKLTAAQADNSNLQLVTRALALGAIGALMSIFAKFLSTAKATAIFDDNSFARMWASMAMGAIVGVVAIALFYTGFISIFARAEQQVSGNPDFWKITIVCLLAGAFSDRLFQAAAGRMDQYLATGGQNRSSASKQIATKRTSKKRTPPTGHIAQEPQLNRPTTLVEVGKDRPGAA